MFWTHSEFQKSMTPFRVPACLGLKNDYFSTHSSKELNCFGRIQNLRNLWLRFGSLPAWDWKMLTLVHILVKNWTVLDAYSLGNLGSLWLRIMQTLCKTSKGATLEAMSRNFSRFRNIQWGPQEVNLSKNHVFSQSEWGVTAFLLVAPP